MNTNLTPAQARELARMVNHYARTVQNTYITSQARTVAVLVRLGLVRETMMDNGFGGVRPNHVPVATLEEAHREAIAMETQRQLDAFGITGATTRAAGMPIEARKEVFERPGGKDGEGRVRTWGRTINGRHFAFNVVNMPNGDLRLFVRVYNGYADSDVELLGISQAEADERGMKWGCAWTLLHSIILPTADAYRLNTDPTGLRPACTDAEKDAHHARNIIADQEQRDAAAAMRSSAVDHAHALALAPTAGHHQKALGDAFTAGHAGGLMPLIRAAHAGQDKTAGVPLEAAVVGPRTAQSVRDSLNTRPAAVALQMEPLTVTAAGRKVFPGFTGLDALGVVEAAAAQWDRWREVEHAGCIPAHDRDGFDQRMACDEKAAYRLAVDSAPADGFFAVSSNGTPMRVYILTTLGAHLIRAYDLDAPAESGMDLAAYGSLADAREGLAMFREVFSGNAACCFDTKAEARAEARWIKEAR
jgi:hypothetical protein